MKHRRFRGFAQALRSAFKNKEPIVIAKRNVDRVTLARRNGKTHLYIAHAYQKTELGADLKESDLAYLGAAIKERDKR